MIGDKLVMTDLATYQSIRWSLSDIKDRLNGSMCNACRQTGH